MLETEIAALVRFMDPLNLKTYFKELPEGFATPSVYFPPPEVSSGTHSLSAYSNVFSQIEKSILGRRSRIPLYDKDGKPAGKSFRIDKVGIKNIDTGVTQVTLNWKTLTAYDDETYIKAVNFFYEGLATSKK